MRTGRADSPVHCPWRRCLFLGVALFLCSCQAAPSRIPLADRGSSRTAVAAAHVASDDGSAHTAPGRDVRPGVRPVSHEETAARSQPSGSDPRRQDLLVPPPQGGACCPPAAPWTCQPPITAGPGACQGAWSPPGIACPWPSDEYICDGGDYGEQAVIGRQRTPYGVDPEDTIAHFDTQDGKTRVEASNRVCLYAPRFAAVRKVSSIVQYEQHDRAAGVELPISPDLRGSTRLATTVVQPVQPAGQRSTRFLQGYRERHRTVGAENVQAPAGAESGLFPYEDFLIIRSGQFDNSEKARLAARLQAAIAWTQDKAVQVVIDGAVAVESSGDLGLQSIYTYDMPPGKPRLRIVKIASQQDAHPGELIHFTLRFDNVGDQPLANVTILDNLSRRLEYVAGSQECSRTAAFSVQENEGESLVLKWGLADPLPVGEGGVIRFQCRVR